MAASFLHGVETIEIDDGAKPIKAVKSAVIGLVGTALSKEGKDDVKLVLSAKDIAQFGPEAGGTIVPALNAIYAQGGAQVFVVNKQKVEKTPRSPLTGKATVELTDLEGVYKTDATAEGTTVTDGKITLSTGKYVVKYASTIKNIEVTDTEGTKEVLIHADAVTENVTVYKMPPCTTGDTLVIEDAEINEVYTVNDGTVETEITVTSIEVSEAPISLDVEKGGLFKKCSTEDIAEDAFASTMTIAVDKNLAVRDTVLVKNEAGAEELLVVGADKKIVSSLSGTITEVLLLLVEGDDFTVVAKPESIIKSTIVKDPNGRLEGTISATYIKASATAVTDGDIEDGFGEFERLYNQYGFLPKILIAPDYSQIHTVAAKMVAAASKIRAIALLDVDADPLKTGTDTDIGLLRSKEAFNTSSDRVMFAYPKLKVGKEEVCYSQYLAGVIAAKDVEKGYWWSPSNTEIKGITGVSKNLTAMINDPNSEVNVLNEAAITTVFNSFGTGLRVWGNRNASFPAASGAQTFINVRRVADIVHESIEYAMLQFIDRPINNALIDAISESVNSFMRTLISRGAILDGKCWFDPAKNEAAEISNGHLVFSYDFMPPTPAERISFESKINIEYLKALGA